MEICTHEKKFYICVSSKCRAQEFCFGCLTSHLRTHDGENCNSLVLNTKEFTNESQQKVFFDEEPLASLCEKISELQKNIEEADSQMFIDHFAEELNRIPEELTQKLENSVLKINEEQEFNNILNALKNFDSKLLEALSLSNIIQKPPELELKSENISDTPKIEPKSEAIPSIKSEYSEIKSEFSFPLKKYDSSNFKIEIVRQHCLPSSQSHYIWVVKYLLKKQDSLYFLSRVREKDFKVDYHVRLVYNGSRKLNFFFFEKFLIAGDNCLPYPANMIDIDSELLVPLPKQKMKNFSSLNLSKISKFKIFPVSNTDYFLFTYDNKFCLFECISHPKLIYQYPGELSNDGEILDVVVVVRYNFALIASTAGLFIFNFKIFSISKKLDIPCNSLSLFELNEDNYKLLVMTSEGIYIYRLNFKSEIEYSFIDKGKLRNPNIHKVINSLFLSKSLVLIQNDGFEIIDVENDCTRKINLGEKGDDIVKSREGETLYLLSKSGKIIVYSIEEIISTFNNRNEAY